jgi:hypothetical protein
LEGLEGTEGEFDEKLWTEENLWIEEELWTEESQKGGDDTLYTVSMAHVESDISMGTRLHDKDT